MRETPVCTAADAIYKLAAGNLKYLNAENGSGDISRRIRMSTWAKGQSPYAIIVTCSDSRVIPENIFSAASVSCSSSGWRATSSTTTSWAASSTLPAIWAVGWWWCWAIPTAARWMPPSTTNPPAISATSRTRSRRPSGGDRPYKASCLNVRHSVQEIEKSLCIHNIEEETGLRVVGAMYHIEDGSVEFL